MKSETAAKIAQANSLINEAKGRLDNLTGRLIASEYLRTTFARLDQASQILTDLEVEAFRKETLSDLAKLGEK